MLIRLFLLVLIFVAPGMAAANATANDLVARAQNMQLVTDPQWLALLHINRGGILRGRGRSYVDDPAFFLSPRGNEDAAAELAATVQALFPDAGMDADTDEPDAKTSASVAARCRFVARYRWLAARLDQPLPDFAAQCPEYTAWRSPLQAAQVTLVFPGSYLNSPSSMFGHTLLRIDPPAESSPSVLLSWAVSFGAEVKPADNSILYIWKGIGGGYPGLFMVEPYFAKIQQYGRMENRDLWEYPLSLTATETAFLVDHLWELRNTRFDYYFFDENCSYRLLELIEVARPSLQLTMHWRLSEVPVNTIRGVAVAGLSGKAQLRPSSEQELRARIATLTDAEQDMALALFAGTMRTDAADFIALPRARQAAILATAYAQIVYRSRKTTGRNAVLATRSMEFLRALNGTGEKPAAPVAQPPPPEAGHRTRRITLGGGRLGSGDISDNAADFTVIGFRPSYHDLLDPRTGYLHGAELEILDTEIRLDGAGNVKLERLDVASVFSLSPHDRFFRSFSWRVRGGIERAPMPDGQIHSARYMEGGGGLAWRSGDVFARAFVEGRIEHNGAHESLVDIAAGPAIGLNGQHRWLGWEITARPLFFGSGFRRTEARAALQWQLSTAWALRADMRWRKAEEGQDMILKTTPEMTDAQLTLQHYF